MSRAKYEISFGLYPDKFDADLSLVSLCGPFVRCVEMYFEFNLNFCGNLQCLASFYIFIGHVSSIHSVKCLFKSLGFFPHSLNISSLICIIDFYEPSIEFLY